MRDINGWVILGNGRLATYTGFKDALTSSLIFSFRGVNMIGIYKITNILNDKCYIGQSINIYQRWAEHKYISIHEIERFKNNKFYNAIKKYGIENFSFDILEETSIDKLNERERFWINYYNSFYDGYNSTIGGQNDGHVYFNIDKIKELWDEGYSIPEIVFLIGCSDNTVVRYLTNYKDFNSQNSRERTLARQKYRIFDIKNYPSYQNLKLQRIPVFQYSLNGDYIASYSSIEEAARSLNKNNPENIGDIFRNKNRKSAYGFQWSQEKVEKMPPYKRKNSNSKLLKCKETQQVFSSIKEALEWCHLKSKTSIIRSCKNGNSAGKHPETKIPLHWEYIK